jgi:hypothetical protein
MPHRVVNPNRLVGAGAAAGLTICRLTRLPAACPSLQVRDAVLASGMASGAAISYDRLEDLVAELQRL